VTSTSLAAPRALCRSNCRWSVVVAASHSGIALPTRGVEPWDVTSGQRPGGYLNHVVPRHWTAHPHGSKLSPACEGISALLKISPYTCARIELYSALKRYCSVHEAGSATVPTETPCQTQCRVGVAARWGICASSKTLTAKHARPTEKALALPLLR